MQRSAAPLAIRTHLPPPPPPPRSRCISLRLHLRSASSHRCPHPHRCCRCCCSAPRQCSGCPAAAGLCSASPGPCQRKACRQPWWAARHRAAPASAGRCRPLPAAPLPPLPPAPAAPRRRLRERVGRRTCQQGRCLATVQGKPMGRRSMQGHNSSRGMRCRGGGSPNSSTPSMSSGGSCLGSLSTHHCCCPLCCSGSCGATEGAEGCGAGRGGRARGWCRPACCYACGRRPLPSPPSQTLQHATAGKPACAARAPPHTTARGAGTRPHLLRAVRPGGTGRDAAQRCHHTGRLVGPHGEPGGAQQQDGLDLRQGQQQEGRRGAAPGLVETGHLSVRFGQEAAPLADGVRQQAPPLPRQGRPLPRACPGCPSRLKIAPLPLLSCPRG